MEVIIAGAGWAGIAAAVELAARGTTVTLVEVAAQLGGRARRVDWGELALDNGAHILLGAYHHTLGLLARVGIDQGGALLRLPLRLELVRADGSGVELRAPNLPAPLHLAWALLRCAGLTLGSRLRALRLCAHLIRTRFMVTEDRSVAEWLVDHDQPREVSESLWEPLCIAALNTPPSEASARMFVRVLGLSFLRRRSDSDLLLPRSNLGAMLPEPAADYIKAAGGHIRLRQRVTGLRIREGRIAGLDTAAGALHGDRIVLALPPVTSARLFATHSSLATLAASIEALGHEPICTVYLRYPTVVDPGTPMLGLIGRTGQWVFDRRLTGQPGVLSVVMSASGPHMSLDNDTLLGRIGSELAEIFPHWPAWESGWVLREKRATFACRVGIDDRRPGHRTPVRGLWLAGDFTDTSLPGTLEGAVASGLQCARMLLTDAVS